MVMRGNIGLFPFKSQQASLNTAKIRAMIPHPVPHQRCKPLPSPIRFRRATREDLESIVSLLAADELGKGREDPTLPLAQPYLDAFTAIEADNNQLLSVATDDTQVVGTLMLTFIPGLSRFGAWRGQIEAVRIANTHRGARLGEQFFEWAIAQCRERDCSLIQLTTDKTRNDAHRFYDKLGFTASHEGYKLNL